MKTYLIFLVAIIIFSACQNAQNNPEVTNDSKDSENFSIFLLSNANLNSQFDVDINNSEIDYAIASAQASGQYATVDSLVILMHKYEQLRKNVQVVQNEINKYHKNITGESLPHLYDQFDNDIPDKEKIKKVYQNIDFYSSKTVEAQNVVDAFNHFLNWSIKETDSLQNHSLKIADTGYAVGQKDILFNTFSELIIELENSDDQNNHKTIQLILATENSMYHIENWISHFYQKIIKRIEKETDVNTLYRI